MAYTRCSFFFFILSLKCHQCNAESLEKTISNSITEAMDSIGLSAQTLTGNINVQTAGQTKEIEYGSTQWQRGRFKYVLDPKRVMMMDKMANLVMEAERIFNLKMGSSTGSLQSSPAKEMFREQISNWCTSGNRTKTCDPNDPYRSADGTCNNLHRPFAGASFQPLPRFLPPDYEAGYKPRTKSVSGGDLPSTRLITNVMCQAGTSEKRSKEHTVLFTVYGQFLDHDLTKSPVVLGPNNEDLDCCDEAMKSNSNCFPIVVPDDDPRPKKCISVARSAAAVNNDCDPDTRQQSNVITGYIDGSQIYGSDIKTQLSLRGGDSRQGGGLVSGERGLLSAGANDSCIKEDDQFCFTAGDTRNSEITSLTVTHTVFMRYHNYIAKSLRALNPQWQDQKLFDESRKIIAAVLQHITYNEYLPGVLGECTMGRFGLYSRNEGHDTVYKSSVLAAPSNVFSAAAFRFGHSAVGDFLILLNESLRIIEKSKLENNFFQPRLLFILDGVDHLARWMVRDSQFEEDRRFQDSIRQFLFKDKNGGIGDDLPAINMQRGRDHGIPSYNKWRKWCGLRPAVHFGNGYAGLINHAEEERKLLQSLYEHPDDIDLFIGAMSERRLQGAAVGPVFACILGQSFQNLKVGDRFWYENNFPKIGFTSAQLSEIKKTLLSSVFCQTLKLEKMQPLLLKRPGIQRNAITDCKSHHQIDLRHWKE